MPPIKSDGLEPLDVITAVVPHGRGNEVARAAVEAGAQAVTIFHGRGTGVREKLKFLGVAIHPEKEVLFTVVPAGITERVFDAVFKAGRIGEPGMGFLFVQEVKRASGWLSGDLKTVT
jgi:nitrogen regulatory protein PII